MPKLSNPNIFDVKNTDDLPQFYHTMSDKDKLKYLETRFKGLREDIPRVVKDLVQFSDWKSTDKEKVSLREANFRILRSLLMDYRISKEFANEQSRMDAAAAAGPSGSASGPGPSQGPD